MRNVGKHTVKIRMDLGPGQSTGDVAIDRIAELEAVLSAAKKKLELYRAQHSGEYVGGVEYTELMARIDAALSK